jgi:nucleoside-diphosphate kinase
MGLDKTLVLVKPDAIRRGMLGTVISRFEKKGLAVLAVRAFAFDDALLREHYAHLADKPFFPRIASYMKSDLTVALCVAGVEAVEVVRELVGVTNGRKAAPGSIRGDYSMSIQKNLVHASDSPEAAEAELQRFFPEGIVGERFIERAHEYYSADEIE